MREGRVVDENLKLEGSRNKEENEDLKSLRKML